MELTNLYVSTADVITGRTFYSERLDELGNNHHIYKIVQQTNLTIRDIKMIGSNSYAKDVKEDTGNVRLKHNIYFDIV
ncbi:hypothetical protein ACT7C2_21680 [Bacillus pacificus]